MKPTRVLDEATTPDGQRLTLREHDGDHFIQVGPIVLMSSAAHHSEKRMAELACEGLDKRPGVRVLVGGMGMGYTLRAALDHVGEDATVVVAELLPAVVEWNRELLADHAGHPLDDPRVTVEIGDVVEHLAARPKPYDAILLDVDNGPEPLTSGGNRRLYGTRGLVRIRNALNGRGTVVIWSSFERPPFIEAMKKAQFKTEVVRTRARGEKGPRHTLYVGRRR